MPDLRAKLTAALRRLGRLLPAHHPLRITLSNAWDRVLRLGGRRHTSVKWAGLSFQLQIPLRRLDPNWEAKAAAVWTNLLADGQTVWDVGANVGLYSLLSAVGVGPAGRVVAWEPSPATFAVLTDHVAANKLTGRVQVIQSAVADRRGGSIAFTAEGTDSTNRIATVGAGTIQVPVDTLDGFATDTSTRPDAVKIDIEGAEVLALRGAAALMAPTSMARPIVLLAVHPMFLPEFGCSTDDLEELLFQYKYGCWDLTGSPARPNEYSEYLLLPRERAEAILHRLGGLAN